MKLRLVSVRDGLVGKFLLPGFISAERYGGVLKRCWGIRGLVRDVFYIELIDALGRRGCPLCNVLESAERDYLWTILYERVNDPGVRRDFRRSGGLCNHHAWLLYRLSRSDPLIGDPGPAIIYRDVLESVVEDGDGGGECFICGRLAEKEEAFTEEFARKIVETDLLEAYRGSAESILCRRHYRAIYGKLLSMDRERAEELAYIQGEKLENLLKAMERFIDSFDYRSKHKPTGFEADSTLLAITYLKGRPVTEAIRRRTG